MAMAISPSSCPQSARGACKPQGPHSAQCGSGGHSPKAVPAVVKAGSAPPSVRPWQVKVSRGEAPIGEPIGFVPNGTLELIARLRHPHPNVRKETEAAPFALEAVHGLYCHTCPDACHGPLFSCEFANCKSAMWALCASFIRLLIDELVSRGDPCRECTWEELNDIIRAINPVLQPVVPARKVDCRPSRTESQVDQRGRTSPTG